MNEKFKIFFVYPEKKNICPLKYQRADACVKAEPAKQII